MSPLTVDALNSGKGKSGFTFRIDGEWRYTKPLEYRFNFAWIEARLPWSQLQSVRDFENPKTKINTRHFYERSLMARQGVRYFAIGRGERLS